MVERKSKHGISSLFGFNREDHKRQQEGEKEIKSKKVHHVLQKYIQKYHNNTSANSRSQVLTSTSAAPINAAVMPNAANNALSIDTGERKDLTDMLHALQYDDNDMTGLTKTTIDRGDGIDASRPRGESSLSQLPREVWDVIIDNHLSPLDAANLGMTCKTMHVKLDNLPFRLLQLPQNREWRIQFLIQLDEGYPRHLFCFQCATFHFRIAAGREVLRPSNVSNQLFICPNGQNNLNPQSRIRIASGRMLPFTFVQLCTRAIRFGPEHGLSVSSLDRRWSDGTESSWSHTSRYMINDRNGHLLVRIISHYFLPTISQPMTPAAKRLLIYSRDDEYTPYFSVCSHWRKGELMELCKCALSHIPVQHRTDNARLIMRQVVPLDLPKAMANRGIAVQCSECLTLRRCPWCPTEYTIELKKLEDKSVDLMSNQRFRLALVVTRWSDLGDGIRPDRDEWTAIKGDKDDYDSMKEMGPRSIAGWFEGAIGDNYIGHRLLSLNSKNKIYSETTDEWY